MVNVVSCYMSMLHKIVNLTGMKQERAQIDPGTSMTFWAPSDRNKVKTNPNKPKQTLVLIHGFVGDGILTWQFQALSYSLRATYNLYIPDLVFFGGSHSSRSDRTPRFQADCLAAGLRKLGVRGKCIVVGFSYGGFVGFQMAQHHPDLVGSLVLSGSALVMAQSLNSNMLQRIGYSSWGEFLLPRDAQDIRILLHFGFHFFTWLPLFICKDFFKVMYSNGLKERLELLEALVVKEDVATSDQLTEKIHLLWGEEDKIFDMNFVNDLKEKLGAKTKLVCVAKAGHLVMLERPCVFNRCLNTLPASLTSPKHA